MLLTKFQKARHKNTLKNKRNKSIGTLPVLTFQEEKIIFSRAQLLCDYGFSTTTQDLHYFIKAYLDMKNRSAAQFQKNLPGSEYMLYFLRGHKEFTKRPVANIKRSRAVVDKNVLQQYQVFTKRPVANIKRSRAVVDKNVLQQYHDNLSKELDGVPPSNIRNYDETCLVNDLGANKCIMKRDMRYPKRVVNYTKKRCIYNVVWKCKGGVAPYLLCVSIFIYYFGLMG